MSAVTRLVPFSKDDMARRRRRSLVMALVLLGFVAIFFVTTIVQFSRYFAHGGG